MKNKRVRQSKNRSGGKYMEKISKIIADFETEYMKAEPEEA